jgi:hypothetical protein
VYPLQQSAHLEFSCVPVAGIVLFRQTIQFRIVSRVSHRVVYSTPTTRHRNLYSTARVQVGGKFPNQKL